MSTALVIERADLYGDWISIARQRLISSGFDVSGLVRNDDVGQEYFNALLHLTISIQPRQVYQSDSFSCPHGLANGLVSFIAKVEGGQNLRPCMSRGVKKVANRDGLRYDWGIHHFHLGTTLAPDGFVDRTEPILFAWVTDAAMYMLGTYPHGAWNQKQLLQLIHRNWPALLEPYTIAAAGLSHHLTDKEIGQARRAGVTVALQIADGVVVFPPGGGMPTSGHSMRAVRGNDQLHDSLVSMTEVLSDPTSTFHQELESKGAYKSRVLSYTLVDVQGRCVFIEKHNNLQYEVMGIPALPAL
ncbi:hypothetical protein KB206_20690 [Microvirga sp. STS02]|uniref:hypothetical protein n=1 Tax=Hymenobacter negativus TaxID=2795026 RepID=UPI0018DEBA7F|nr:MULTISPECIES: hypothetical protein [Bacteria]MBH8571322.1 hypothetical protein [Hymenobacter negativus]MBR7211060.1 hypothetical protein [Microvirga sp. STS02]